MRPSSGAAAASWNAKEKGNDDERRVALKTALGGAAKPLARPEALNTALDAKPKPTGDGFAVLGGAVMGGANPRPSGAVLGGSSAAQLSARRLERHGVRMELRKVSARHGALKPTAPTTAPMPHSDHHGAYARGAHHSAHALSAHHHGAHARSAQGGRRPACTCSPRRPLLHRRALSSPQCRRRAALVEPVLDTARAAALRLATSAYRQATRRRSTTRCRSLRMRAQREAGERGRGGPLPVGGAVWPVEWTLCESAERGGPGLAENTHNTATWARGARARLKKGMFSMRENKTASSCTA